MLSGERRQRPDAHRMTFRRRPKLHTGPTVAAEHRDPGKAKTVDGNSPSANLEAALAAAVRAHVDGDRARAVDHAHRAAHAHPDSEFARLLARYVADNAAGAVYDSPAAFRAFIRGGGNVALYAKTSAALQELYRRVRPRSLLDIGAGDGLALIPALTEQDSTGEGSIEQVDVVEPASELLDTTRQSLQQNTIAHRAHHARIQDFATGYAADGWDLVQSTFALQSLPPDERRDTLTWIARHTTTLVVVEFDVPAVADPFAPDWFSSCVARVETGLREYHDDRDLVGLGFILPVILGHFDTAHRTNYEHPITAWVHDLHDAGFTDVRSRLLEDYWWESAHVIEAHQ